MLRCVSLMLCIAGWFVTDLLAALPCALCALQRLLTSCVRRLEAMFGTTNHEVFEGLKLVYLLKFGRFVHFLVSVSSQ